MICLVVRAQIRVLSILLSSIVSSRLSASSAYMTLRPLITGSCLTTTLGRKNVTTFNQLGSRNVRKNLTINRPVHAWFLRRQRMFGSCSIEIAAICVLCKELSGREKVTLDAVMCLVKVNSIHLNISINDTLKRIVGGEDNNILTSMLRAVLQQTCEFCLLWCCCSVMSLSTVNVHTCECWQYQ